MKTVLLLLTVGFSALTMAEEQTSDLLQEFINGNNLFTASLYKEVAKKTSNNFIMSPMSAATVLALTRFGAKEATAKELHAGLFLPPDLGRVEGFFRAFLRQMRGDSYANVTSANRIYVQSGFKIRDSFARLAEHAFQAGAENVDFALAEEAARSINRWVEGRTGGKIRDLVEAATLDPATRAILVNALHFKGQWANKFDSVATSSEDFFRAPGDAVRTEMMHQTKLFNYYESPELGAKFLEMQYKGSLDASMVVVLPNEVDGLPRLERQMERVLAAPKFSLERVIVSLPKFVIESKIYMVDVLKNMGVKKLFSADADLSGIAGNKGDLVVGDVVQKAFINVTEDGTEAAASTSVSALLLSSLEYFTKTEPKVFKADHPFIYYIELNGMKLFGGRVVLPKYF